MKMNPTISSLSLTKIVNDAQRWNRIEREVGREREHDHCCLWLLVVVTRKIIKKKNHSSNFKLMKIVKFLKLKKKCVNFFIFFKYFSQIIVYP